MASVALKKASPTAEKWEIFSSSIISFNLSFFRYRAKTDEQDMEIRPGDYLIADLNGVVVLPVELAEKALPLMQKQVVADEQMAVEIKKGMSFVDAISKTTTAIGPGSLFSSVPADEPNDTPTKIV
ncbi:hypothetical protein NUW58_g9646 [Xylaria curta]|uniref:Uncharacterized protein n=1 Tax=Xylaria curta TaxID=42375 RepID=A0ACC1MUR2_9PEZI|nr:hypothetical protein NUW58_g9646 [Xylaria curta]